MKHNDVQTTMRLPANLLARLEARRARLAQLNPRRNVSLSEVVRVLLLRALKDAERSPVNEAP